jgi:hypothetical protein
MERKLYVMADNALKTRKEILEGKSNPSFLYDFVKLEHEGIGNILDQTLRNVLKIKPKSIVIVNRLKYILALRLLGKKVVLINMNSNHDLDKVSKKGFKNLLLRNYYLLSFRKANKIICLSPTQTKKLEAIGAKNLEQIPLGSDENLVKKFRTKEEGNYYLSAGFDEGKNFNFLKKSLKGQQLIILNKDNKVSYLEYLELMAGCKGFILNIQHSERSSDLSGITTSCEALLLNKPVYINYQPWLKELLKENYHLYKSSDELKNLLKKKTKFKEMDKKHLTLMNFRDQLLKVTESLK